MGGEGAVEVVDEDVGEALAHGAEDGIGKRAGDDAEDGDDFGDCGADGLSGDFLAEHGGDLLDDGVPDGLGECFVGDLLACLCGGHAGGLVDEGGAAGDVEHGAEIAEDAELGLAIKRVVLAGEGCIGARMTSRCL